MKIAIESQLERTMENFIEDITETSTTLVEESNNSDYEWLQKIERIIIIVKPIIFLLIIFIGGTGNRPFGNTFCKIWKTVNNCTAIVSVYTLVGGPILMFGLQS